ncbi:MAG: plasmid stabilization protein [Alishewanella sp. 34-51-39]|jgi:plasmid stabilization system protein ParE|nr:MAG: plasmid stabilization protein [Alishewanella sp. 34-51-39]
MLPVLFHPDVRIEVKATFDWYQEQSLGLGHEFIRELEESIQSICLLPTAWAKMGPTHRRFVLSRFPYSIIYKIFESREIHVMAIMHNHRKPGYWSRRKNI